MPAQPPHFAFRECCRRHNDFAVLSVAATGRVSDDGRWSGLRLGLGGVNDTPVLAEAGMLGSIGSAVIDRQAAKTTAEFAGNLEQALSAAEERRAGQRPEDIAVERE